MHALWQLLRVIPAVLLSMAKWALPLAVLVFLYLSLDKLHVMGGAFGRFFGLSSKPEVPIDKRVITQGEKCRGYAMLANLAGSKSKLEQDKVNVLCTIIRLEESGADACDIFHNMMELVPPGWGRRQTGVPLPGTGRNLYVPKRQFWYVETEFTKPELDAAMLLARRTKDQKLCPADWRAITIIRPNRDRTVGNQRPEEIDAIKKMAPQKLTGPSEFQFFAKQ